MNGPQRGAEPTIRPPATPEPKDKSKGPPPQVFLSYAWESDQHKTWVRKLAERMWESGVETVLDQWDLVPGSDRSLFMERSIKRCDFVIMICTPSFAEKANSREGGVGYESMVLTGELVNQIESRKMIPVLRSGDWKSSLPTYLKSKHGVDLRGDPFNGAQYELLIRTLHGEPVQHPPLGPKPQFAAPLAATTNFQGLIQPPTPRAREAKANQVKWEAICPGPCIDVTVTNSRDVIEAGRAVGLEYPEPLTMKALLDTGAAVTVISKTFAKYCKLLQTGETEIRVLGSVQRCGEHAGAISFLGTNLRPCDPIRIVSAQFVQEQHYAILIGRDILQNWTITFDRRSKRITIID